MKSSFRWYGDSDPVTLDMIRQIPGMAPSSPLSMT